MRVAYVVDVHDRFDVVPDIVAAAAPVELLLLGGDITTGGSAKGASAAIEDWRPLAPRLLAVAGNMDSPEIDESLAELGVALDGRGHVFGDVGVFGLSASPPTPFGTPYELEEEELARRIEPGFVEVSGCRLTVFCPHTPPFGTACDRLPDGGHAGSRAVREFVERAQPDLVLCGHIHEAYGEDRIGRSRIVNPGAARDGRYALVEVGEQIEVSLGRV